MFPHMALAQVTGRSTNPWGVYVMYPTGQGSGVLVQMGLHGSADTLRVSQKALPSEGTVGLVAFPYGDSRNGIWLCSVYTQGNTALVNSSPDVDYEAHPSGAWSLTDQAGNSTFALPDGSFVQFGNAGVKPELTRNVVNASQHIVPMPFPDNTRQASSPTPFPVTLSLASGTTISVDISGNATINLAAGGHLNITQGGSPADFLTLVSKMVAQFNAHTHSDDGAGVPTTLLTPTDINSTLIGIQE